MDQNEAEMKQLLTQLTGHLQKTMPMTERSLSGLQQLRWPSLLPCLRLSSHAYSAPSMGNLFLMQTAGLGGMMNLATVVCTPNQGTDVPLLLMDAMLARKKRVLFIEYYDCTSAGVHSPELQAVAQKYSSLPAYQEKPAWYISERMPESLIKCSMDDTVLQQMALDTADAYGRLCARCTPGTDAAANQAGLSRFADRMVQEGNPSSAMLNRILGKEQAEQFFRTAIMPTVYQPAKEETDL